MYPLIGPMGVSAGNRPSQLRCRRATQSTPGAVRRLSDKRRPGRGVWGEPFANIASPVAEVSLLGFGSKKVTMQREGPMASNE